MQTLEAVNKNIATAQEIIATAERELQQAVAAGNLEQENEAALVELFPFTQEFVEDIRELARG